MWGEQRGASQYPCPLRITDPRWWDLLGMRRAPIPKYTRKQMKTNWIEVGGGNRRKFSFKVVLWVFLYRMLITGELGGMCFLWVNFLTW